MCVWVGGGRGLTVRPTERGVEKGKRVRKSERKSKGDRVREREGEGERENERKRKGEFVCLVGWFLNVLVNY